MLHEGHPFAYLRGETHLSTGELSGAAPLLASGISVVGDTLTAEGFASGSSPYGSHLSLGHGL